MLTVEEKQSLLIHILEDLRGNWAYAVESRCFVAREVALDLGYDHIVESIDGFLNDEDYRDGRWFRDTWENGGYYDPPFEVIRSNPSPAFFEAVENECTYPSWREE